MTQKMTSGSVARGLAVLSLVAVPLALGSCGGPSSKEIAARVLESDPVPELLQGNHRGPGVVAGDTGPNRYVPRLLEAFDVERAMETVRFADGLYRAPGNEGYDLVLDRLEAQLRDAGYGTAEGFEIGIIETPLTARGTKPGQRIPAQAWTPRSGRIVVHRGGDPELVLHEFSEPGDVDRVILPTNALAADVEGGIAFNLEDLDAGEVLVIDAEPRSAVLARARAKGAVAVLSSYLESYNVDPNGSDMHLDAVQFRVLPGDCPLPVGMISPRSMRALEKTHAADPTATVAFKAVVDLEDRPLRTLWVRVVGRDRPEQAVVVSSHIQEPGACDNASGLAGLCESAVSLLRLVRTGLLEHPSRSLVFVWGDEYRQSEIWLDEGGLETVAGLSSDMTGESHELTGAVALLERMPDPGALRALAPDEHSLWGETVVDAADLRPNGLAIIARCAMLDVAAL